MEPIQLTPDANGKCKCPKCGAALTYVDSQPVQIVDGKLNMEDTESHYCCASCESIYRRIVGTAYYQWYQWKIKAKARQRKVKGIEPTKLSPNADGVRTCPSCGAALTFIESQTIKVVNGKLNTQDTEDHYQCEACNAVYRKIVNTNYYQWCAE